MYTFPFAIVGTVYFTAFPAAFPGPCELFHNSLPRFAASYACKMAGPAARLPVSSVPKLLESKAQTIPFVDSREETEGVAPGYPNVAVEVELGVGLKSPLDISNA